MTIEITGYFEGYTPRSSRALSVTETLAPRPNLARIPTPDDSEVHITRFFPRLASSSRYKNSAQNHDNGIHDAFDPQSWHRDGELQSPCPDILRSNYPPTESQLREIRAFCQRMETRIGYVDNRIIQEQLLIREARRQRRCAKNWLGFSDQISTLQTSILRLARLGQYLRNTIVAHRRCVEAAVRWLPNELLSEIFTHCKRMDQATRFNCGASTTLMYVTCVCRRWRDVALSLPKLWTHIVLEELDIFYIEPEHEDWEEEEEECLDIPESTILKRAKGQLERCRNEPFSVTWNIDIYSHHTFSRRILTLFCKESARWEEAALLFNVPQLEYFADSWMSCYKFPLLRKLRLQAVAIQKETRWRHFRDYSAFLHALPALKELHLVADNENIIFPHTMAPWRNLRACVFEGCRVDNVWAILPLFAQTTNVSIENVRGVLRNAHAQNLHMGSLTLKRCPLAFTAFLLIANTFPSLSELSIGSSSSPANVLSLITSVIARSGCRLQRLSIEIFAGDANGADSPLFRLLETAGPSLTHLSVSTSSELPAVVDLLTANPTKIIPKLHSLALTYRWTHKVDGTALIKLHHGRPKLRELSFNRFLPWTEVPVSEVFEESIIFSLRADGLNVVVASGCEL